MKISRPLSTYSTLCVKIVITTFPFVISLAHAQLIDGISAEIGEGDHATIYKLDAEKAMNDDYSFLIQHNLHPYWEFSIADIENRRYQNMPGQSQSVTDIGVTPVLRWQKNQRHGIGGEIGVGVNYFSQMYNNAGQVSGSRFQFGNHIGLSYKWSKNIEISLKLQHYTNAGIRAPRSAINFGMIKVAYTF